MSETRPTQRRRAKASKSSKAKASGFSLDESVGYLVNRAAREMQNSLERELAPFGVTVSQWSLLIRCTSEGPQPSSALGKQLSVDASAITRLVDRLIAKGLVERREKPGDRRTFMVAVTPKGRALAKKLPPFAQAVLDRYLAGFSESEVKTLQQFLVRLIENGQ